MSYLLFGGISIMDSHFPDMYFSFRKKFPPRVDETHKKHTYANKKLFEIPFRIAFEHKYGGINCLC